MSIITIRKDSGNLDGCLACILFSAAVEYTQAATQYQETSARTNRRKERYPEAMYVVAIYGIGADKEHLANALSSALGRTLLEARSRLNAPGSGPFVVGIFSEKERAAGLAVQLRNGGFNAVVLGEDEIMRDAGRKSVRRFDLGEGDLQAEPADGGSRTVAYSGIDLILRGTSISSNTTTEATKQRSFSLGRAVLTSGLSMTKTTKTVREVTQQEREGFFILYAGDDRPLEFRENGLLYDSLGPARKPSRAANFAFLVSELRRRCRAARYDERLLTRAGQAALLGPSLNPEEHLAVATALLAKVLRGK